MLTSSFPSLRFLNMLVVGLVSFVYVAASLSAAPKSGYKSFIVGNPADAPQSPTLSPGLVLVGGGTDVDEDFNGCVGVPAAAILS